MLVRSSCDDEFIEPADLRIMGINEHSALIASLDIRKDSASLSYWTGGVFLKSHTSFHLPGQTTKKTA